MRKDVKLGFAIGGVLLAVAIVFALVNSSHPKQATAVADGSDAVQTDTTATDSGKTDAGKPAVASVESGKAAPGKVEPTKVDGPKGDATKAGAPTDTAKADQPESHDIFGKTSTNWEESLKTGTPVPLMAGVMGSTPTDNGIKNDPQSGVNTPKHSGSTVSGVNYVGQQAATPAPTATPITGTVHNQQADADDLLKGSAAPAGSPTSVRVAAPDTRTASTHTIKNGETFVTIAAAYYGNGKYYKLIAAANPKADPLHLKIGQVITLPAFDGKAADTAKSSAKPTPAAERLLDTKTQYRVQSGDNLHRICVKLYGDASKVDDVYSLNKAAIGSDPAKLKLGMILTLPTAPTATASR